MDALFTILEFLGYGALGLMALVCLLFVVALLFGKRVNKQWEYEAEFRGPDGREVGEFDIELSQIDKEEPAPTVKAKLSLRHPALTLHQTVQVFLERRLILEGMVDKPGRILISRKLGEADVGAVQAGQGCRIVCGSDELFSEPLKPD